MLLVKLRAFPAVVAVPRVLFEFIEKFPTKLMVPEAVALLLMFSEDPAEGLIVKLPPTLRTLVPPATLAIAKVVAALGFIKKLEQLIVAPPEVAIVLVEAIELLILKSPVTETVLFVPVVESTNRAEPSTTRLPPTVNELL